MEDFIKNKHREEINKMGYKIIDEYMKKGTLYFIVKDNNGYKNDSSIYNLLKYNNSYIASKSNPFSLENISLWLKLNKKDFELCKDNVYKNNSDKLKLYHSKCDDYFYMSWNCIKRGQSCSVCSGKQTGEKHGLNNLMPDLDKEWSSENSLNSKDVALGCEKSVWWICSKCNHRWYAKINNRAIQGTGCPRCTTSKGESKIKNYLNSCNIKYDQECNDFKDCRNKYVLSFDFYLSHYNVLIEYQGPQHYNSIDFFGGMKYLIEQKKRDKIKVKYCKKNNIKLIVIPYWDFDNIELILQKELMEE